MSDLISRQAAIDALCSECQGRCIPCESYPCSEVEVINALPPAEPEITMCKECKHYPVGGDQYEHTLKFPDERCPCYCEDKWYSWRPGDNWFCANGERKDNA